MAAVGAGPDDVAQQLFREGVEAARQERWEDARAAFEKAYGLSGRPVVLINLAGAQARTGRLAEAASNYHRILEDAASTETAPFRKAAADVLPALEARIPRIRLRPSDFDPADVVEIDGEQVAAERLSEWHPLDPGGHTLVVKRLGVERARIAFSLAERESHDISLPVAVLPLAAVAPPLADGSARGASLVPSDQSPSESPRRVWWKSPRLWIAVGVVAAASTAATIFILDRNDQPFSGNVSPGIVSVR